MSEESNKKMEEQNGSMPIKLRLWKMRIGLWAIGFCLILMSILNILYPEQVHLPISFGMFIFGLYLLVAK